MLALGTEFIYASHRPGMDKPKPPIGRMPPPGSVVTRQLDVEKLIADARALLVSVRRKREEADTFFRNLGLDRQHLHALCLRMGSIDHQEVLMRQIDEDRVAIAQEVERARSLLSVSRVAGPAIAGALRTSIRKARSFDIRNSQ